MAVVAYINFKGNCREAVGFYADVFGAHAPVITTYGSQGGEFPLPEAVKDLVMHAELNIMGTPVMFSDVFDGDQYKVGNNISLTLISGDQKALEDAFHKLEIGGTVSVPLQQTFWTNLYGFVTDRYGIGWQVSHEAAASGSAETGGR
jgi:PhnB protein